MLLIADPRQARQVSQLAELFPTVKQETRVLGDLMTLACPRKIGNGNRVTRMDRYFLNRRVFWPDMKGKVITTFDSIAMINVTLAAMPMFAAYSDKPGADICDTVVMNGFVNVAHGQQLLQPLPALNNPMFRPIKLIKPNNADGFFVDTRTGDRLDSVDVLYLLSREEAGTGCTALAIPNLNNP